MVVVNILYWSNVGEVDLTWRFYGLGGLSEIYWYIRNLISYSSVDKFPENYLMHNYDEYWNKVLEKDGGGDLGHMKENWLLPISNSPTKSTA